MRPYTISAWTVLLNDWTTMSKSNPWEVVFSVMIHWKNVLGNWNAEEPLCNVIFSLIEAILSSVLKY